MGVTISGDHFKHPIVDGQNGHIERSTAQVEDQYVLLSAFLVQAVSNGCGRRFVDDAGNIQPRNSPCILGGLSLGIVEVGRNSDHCILDGFSKKAFGCFLHLREHHGTDLLWRKLFLFSLRIDFNVWLGVFVDNGERHKFHVPLDFLVTEFPANESLHVVHGTLRVGSRLILCGIPNESFSVGEGHVGRSDSVPLIVGDDLHTTILVHTHTRVGGSQIDPNHRSHVFGVFLGMCQVEDSAEHDKKSYEVWYHCSEVRHDVHDVRLNVALSSIDGG
mmetsp:Transcript_1373/g.8508  ORF Transcript_1373/g.8508 Transcript_1373/m.8508 type:complete len:275 (-) Transcript_1373:28-852(-)